MTYRGSRRTAATLARALAGGWSKRPVRRFDSSDFPAVAELIAANREAEARRRYGDATVNGYLTGPGATG
jgi:hypothetical protein